MQESSSAILILLYCSMLLHLAHELDPLSAQGSLQFSRESRLSQYLLVWPLGALCARFWGMMQRDDSWDGRLIT